MDTRLLNQAREYSEQLIDELYYGVELWSKKPRTYRRVARKEYLAFAKKRKTTAKQIRRAKRKQLGYVRRNIKHLHRMLDQIEAYKQLYGYYPELVLADKAYLTRPNRNYLKANGIRHVGPPPGRKPQISKHEKEKRRKEKINGLKSRVSLDRENQNMVWMIFRCVEKIHRMRAYALN